MKSPLLIAISAGIVSGILFASIATGSAVALALFYLAPLPLLVAGLGWGTAAVGIGAATAAITSALAIGLAAGPLHVAGIGGPCVVLVYLSLLSRAGPEEDASQREWYPPGRLLAWIALMGGGLAAVAVPLIGTDTESYTATVKGLIETHLLEQLQQSQSMDAESLKTMGEVLARALPAAFATIWASVMAFNLWAAGRIVLASGRLSRPWPDLHAIEVPATVTAAFAAAVLLSLLPNLLGIAATGFAGALFLPYIALGLAVIHTITMTMPLRAVLLGALYLGIFLFGWIALLLGILGLGEPAFKLRERAAARASGPPSNHT